MHDSYSCSKAINYTYQRRTCNKAQQGIDPPKYLSCLSFRKLHGLAQIYERI